ncbi:TIR domain-containing protein [Nocardia sp. NPDC056541]|uniref:TIR domain-containing protein n=1 Tax=unclassified Nocardia TaxID=2637762 RepID=UPI003669974E
MADIAISYSHLDTELAYEVRNELLAAGHTVWIDETGDFGADADGIAVPFGADHWQVIEAEFAAADLVVVIDTARWWASPNCAREYDTLTSWGKWVEFHQPGTTDVVALAAPLASRRHITGAHARLIQRMESTGPHSPGLVERWFRRADADDARTILGPDAATAGITVGERLGVVAERAIDNANRVRRRVLRSATVLTAVLAVCAVVGLIALNVAVRQRDSATRSANTSMSLNTASQAGDQDDTSQALALAHRAAGFAPTSAATSALNVANANNRRLQSFSIAHREYVGAQWAADAPIIVAYTRTGIYQLDARSGREIASIGLGERSITSIAVSRTGERVVLGDGVFLLVADFVGGRVEEVTGNVNFVATADGEHVWVASSAEWPQLRRTAFRDAANPIGGTTYRLPTAPKALAIDESRRVVDYLDGRGTLHSARFTETEFVDVGTHELVPPAEVDVDERGARISRCGENVYGVTPKRGLFDISFSRIGGRVTTEDVSFFSYPPICNPDGTAWGTYVSGPSGRAFGGGPTPYLPWGVNRYVPVVDTVGARTAVVTPDGWLYVMPGERIEVREIDDATALIALPTTEFAIRRDGSVVDTATGVVTGHAGSEALSPLALTIGSVAMIGTDDGIVRIDERGSASLVVAVDRREVASIRAGSDSKTFVAAGGRTVRLLGVDGSVRAIEMSWLDSRYRLADADISPDGRSLVVSTTGGQVAVVDLNAPASARFWAQQMPVGSILPVAFVARTGAVFVVGADGIVRLLGPELDVRATAFVGDQVRQAELFGDHAVVTSSRNGITVFDTGSLVVTDAIPAKVTSVTAFTVRGNQLVGLSVGTEGEEATQSRRIRIPLP